MEIPQFPQSRDVLLEDRSWLAPLFWELQPRISELTFANIFLFRKVHEYRLTSVQDSVVALGKGYDGTDYFLPPLSGDIGGAAVTLVDRGLTLYGADDLFLERYLKGRELLITEDRDNFDYLHIKEEMALLHGRAYHRKKNHVNYFMLRHRYEVESYDRDRHLEGAQTLLAEWFRVRSAMEAGAVQGEVCGAAEALRLDRELGLQGIVVIVDGAVKGFALGEQLNRETAVCHFEKGDLFIDGLSQFLDREFARLLFTECRYINREQDLGSESLRQSKLSYRPIELVKKYRVRRP
jgi:uncharacterized protein